jgi:hypothetical protein
MIADVQFLHAVDQGARDVGMAMAEVEDAAIAVAIDQARLAGHVPDEGAIAPTRDKLNARRAKEVDFARRHVLGKALDRGGSIVLANVLQVWSGHVSSYDGPAGNGYSIDQLPVKNLDQDHTVDQARHTLPRRAIAAMAMPLAVAAPNRLRYAGRPHPPRI